MDHRGFLTSLGARQRQDLAASNAWKEPRHLVLHGGPIALASAAIAAKVPGWRVLVIPQGILLVLHFTLLCETSHRTPFRSRLLDAAVGHVSGFVPPPPTGFGHSTSSIAATPRVPERTSDRPTRSPRPGAGTSATPRHPALEREDAPRRRGGSRHRRLRSPDAADDGREGGPRRPRPPCHRPRPLGPERGDTPPPGVDRAHPPRPTVPAALPAGRARALPLRRGHVRDRAHAHHQRGGSRAPLEHAIPRRASPLPDDPVRLVARAPPPRAAAPRGDAEGPRVVHRCLRAGTAAMTGAPATFRGRVPPTVRGKDDLHLRRRRGMSRHADGARFPILPEHAFRLSAPGRPRPRERAGTSPGSIARDGPPDAVRPSAVGG